MTTKTQVEYETVIGLEVHVQLSTRSKMYCRCSADYADSPPNTHVCPICLGMPGVLPVINQQAVEYTIMTALALNCEIPEYSKFDRKNYPYPDLMKGYQISQYDMPLSRNGWLEIDLDGGRKRIGITRVHLEEDVAKLLHRQNEAGETYSLIDVNRAGVPLMEIVSEPDMRSPEEARQYLVKLRQILRYIGVSTANMEEGSFRCDANISLRPVGETELGAKVEVKNMNSFRAVFRALSFEVERQRELLQRGRRLPQETRGWLEEQGKTVPQRTKEYAHDYRYFPEPDLPPLRLDRDYVEAIRTRLPELPDARKQRFMQQYGLTEYEAGLLTETRPRADYLDAALAPLKDAPPETLRRRAKSLTNWILGDFMHLLNSLGIEIDQSKIEPQDLYDMITLVEDGTISGRSAKTVFEKMFETGKSPRVLVEELGLTQISGADEISTIVDRILEANPKAVQDYRSGKTEAVRFLVGQVMRETKGRANADLVNSLLRERLGQA
ncbi:MAG: Asp-tRNA(Asn)/Glu-tRNA(Gln) amidotransferase subunit GatB [Dehalococcoidia bacterium]|nr:Asp-tRNA(Asn)/Glu-tRNA(Gln) amidotransferase subunit GatB [Dehalococcoidia bacterium]